MSALQRASVHVILTGSALAVFFGVGLAVNTISGYPASELYVWAWLWAATSSLTLAITLATFCLEISDLLTAAWARSLKTRGRHVSSGGYYAAHSDADPDAPHPTAAFQPYPQTGGRHASR